MDANTVADWYLNERGIERETLRAFNVTMEGSNVIFPYPNGRKERPDPTVPLREDQRRFYFTKGESPMLFQPPTPSVDGTAFLCEGETDTMRLWQAVGAQYPVFGLGGVGCWDPRTKARLQGYQRVYVVLDNDPAHDYLADSASDIAWRKIRHDLGPKAKRIILPRDIKDVCEFFLAGYGTEELKILTERSANSLYTPVDFTVAPPAVSWCVEGMLAMGDVNILSGLGGLGKSVTTMALTAAMLRGDTEFLGLPLVKHGKILYVDEENPLDVIHSRLRRFGLDPRAHASQLRYLAQQHIRLDRDPDRLLDEAIAYGPDLFVLDSLTRLHGSAEDDSGEMGRLMNDGLLPLARETGAAVILIHHHDKGAKSARGSSDIRNSADGTYDVRGIAGIPEHFVLTPDKSRRKRAFDALHVAILDRPDGGLELKATDPVSPIF